MGSTPMHYLNPTTRRKPHRRGEFGDEAIQHLARALRDYLARPGSRGASAWLDGRDFHPVDRAAIVQALVDAEDAA